MFRCRNVFRVHHVDLYISFLYNCMKWSFCSCMITPCGTHLSYGLLWQINFWNQIKFTLCDDYDCKWMALVWLSEDRALIWKDFVASTSIVITSTLAISGLCFVWVKSQLQRRTALKTMWYVFLQGQTKMQENHNECFHKQTSCFCLVCSLVKKNE